MEVHATSSQVNQGLGRRHFQEYDQMIREESAVSRSDEAIATYNSGT